MTGLATAGSWAAGGRTRAADWLRDPGLAASWPPAGAAASARST